MATNTRIVQDPVVETMQSKAARLTALLEKYPDLTLPTAEDMLFQCSKAVNAIATDFEIAVSCSCCPDPELYVRVFVETPHGRVYGVPYQMLVGEQDEGMECPAVDWDQTLRAHGIHPSIIDRLKTRFDSEGDGV